MKIGITAAIIALIGTGLVIRATMIGANVQSICVTSVDAGSAKPVTKEQSTVIVREFLSRANAHLI